MNNMTPQMFNMHLTCGREEQFKLKVFSVGHDFWLCQVRARNTVMLMRCILEHIDVLTIVSISMTNQWQSTKQHFGVFLPAALKQIQITPRLWFWKPHLALLCYRDTWSLLLPGHSYVKRPSFYKAEGVHHDPTLLTRTPLIQPNFTAPLSMGTADSRSSEGVPSLPSPLSATVSGTEIAPFCGENVEAKTRERKHVNVF